MDGLLGTQYISLKDAYNSTLNIIENSFKVQHEDWKKAYKTAKDSLKIKNNIKNGCKMLKKVTM